MANDYLTDDAVPDVGDDLLSRAPYARRIAETLAGRNDSAGLVVGIYGKWGDGKSSLLNMIAQRISEAGLVVLRFNPWYVRGEEQLIVAFFGELAARLGMRVGEKRRRLMKIFGEYGGLAASLVPVAGVGDTVKGLTKVASHLAEEPLEKRRGKVEKELTRLAIRVIVLVDDIDRLDRDGVYAMVKLVKLTANLPYITFELAFDDAVVSRVLAERYPNDESDMGGGYLEKIVQVPLHMPVADAGRMRDLFGRYMRDAAGGIQPPVDEATWHDILGYVEPLIDSAPRTLRVAKRLANGIAFALPLVAEDVNVADFILLESLRALYPAVYRRMRLARAALVGTWRPGPGTPGANPAPSEVESVRTSLTESLTPAEGDAVWRLLQRLFPRLSGGSGAQGDEARWTRERRIASSLQFDRYFTFEAAPADVVSETFRDLQQTLQRGKRPEATALLRGLITNDPGGGVPTELARTVYWGTEPSARCLVGAILGVSDLLADQLVTPPSREELADMSLLPAPPWPDDPAVFLPLQALVLRSLPLDVQHQWEIACANTGDLRFAMLWFDYVALHEQDAPALLTAATTAAVRDALTARCYQWMMTTGRELRGRNPDDVFTIVKGWSRLVGRHELTAALSPMWQSSYRQPAELLDALTRAMRITFDGAENIDTFEPVFDQIDAIIDPTRMIEPLNKVLTDSASGTTEPERQASHREHVLAHFFRQRYQR